VPTRLPPWLAWLPEPLATGTGLEPFAIDCNEWLKTVKQPKLGVPYIDLVYKPMLELLELLKAHEFRVFVCSGGGRDFMRVFAEETWGIFKENVIGTAAEYTYADGKVVRAEHALGSLDVGPKPEHIFAQTGRLRLRRGQRRRGHRDAGAATFSVIVTTTTRSGALHSGADASFVKAKERLTVISMKNDWNTVF
jgi:hypothetical protein